MASNRDQVIEKYQDGREAYRATESRNSGLEFHYTKKHIDEYITQEASVIEIGCGTGYYGMHYSDKCRAYVGVDITPGNIAVFNEMIKNEGLKNVTAQVGDATDLSGIPDGSFDVVLCLGPLYHLPPDEREQVFAECKRICRQGGILAFAYINRVGAYAGACVHDQYREYYPNEKANDFVLKQSRDDLRPNLFFYTMPEEIEAVAKKYGLSKVKNLGTDFFVTMSIVDAMNEGKFALMKPLLDEMSSHESCTGMSNHALLVCRK